jgi:5-methyltetrahydropteroyltriglutamate--homocysteine methyltransferase
MSLLSLPVSTLGVPRIGPRRELKAALESYWSGKSDAANLLESAAGLRAANWARQHALGVTNIPSNDFSLYDHVLDTSVMVGAIPEICGWTGGPVPLETYFAMARGSQGDNHDAACAHGQEGDAHGVPALEMTKWFDTNYHYMVPEFTKGQRFTLSSTKPVDEYREATALGYHTRPVLLGPVTYLKLGKSKDPTLDPLSLLGGLLPVYVDVLRRLAENGAYWVQIDEPCLVFDLDDATGQVLREAYGMFAYALPTLKIMLTTYFGGLENNLDIALELPVAGLHLDLVRAPGQLDAVLAKAPQGLVLSLGVVDGRNVWRANLPRDPRPPGARGRQARLGSRGDCPVLLAAARADRPRARDRPRSRPEELARLLGAEDGRACDPRQSAGQRPRSGDPADRGFGRGGRHPRSFTEGA